jgi:hypothetical protein
MAKTRIDLVDDPMLWWGACCFHVWISNHEPLFEAHTIKPMQQKDIPYYFPSDPDQFGTVGYFSPVPDEALALPLCQVLEHNPDLISDHCYWCHNLNPRGWKLRWNLMRGQRYPYLDPAQISPDFLWHFPT